MTATPRRKPPKRAPWSDAEARHLEQLCGDVPPRNLLRHYNGWASHYGYPIRSYHSIHALMKRRGLSARPCGAYITTGYIAAVLGIGVDTPQRWVSKGYLPTVKRRNGSPQHYLIRRADVITLANEQPHLFGGIPPERLTQLLEDRQLAVRIAAAHTKRRNDPQPVRCVERGWRYETIRQAADAVFVTRQAIGYAITTGGTAGGFHWERAA